jgi:glycosyltransferase involved in cell wall biosynthesis
LLGRPSVGVVFFETDDIGRDAAKKVEHHACIVAGSNWNAEVLRAHGIPRVETVLQGIDPALFHPAPKNNLFPGRFLVFSGGKLETRKGQDKVLAAWRIFSARHPDAMLVTAWYSPWPHFAREINSSECAAPLPFTQDGNPDIEGWAVANGIKPDQFLNLGAVPNASMPLILREMDAAIFPNRCEGGTNLVAMEAMACGVPTILSANSGHLDLLQDGAALPLTDQRPIQTASGWHESNLEEMVAALEKLYGDRTCASVLGATGAERLSRMTWSKTSAQMKSIIKTL